MKSLPGSATGWRSDTSGGGSTGGIGISGAIAGDILNSDTAASVADNAKVNTGNAGDGADQTVNVSAANVAHVFGVPVNVTGATFALGGGIDLGIVRKMAEEGTIQLIAKAETFV